MNNLSSKTERQEFESEYKQKVIDAIQYRDVDRLM